MVIGIDIREHVHELQQGNNTPFSRSIKLEQTQAYHTSKTKSKLIYM